MLQKEPEGKPPPTYSLAQLCDGEIPSPAAIHAAKKRRELARNNDDTGVSQIDIKTSVDVHLVSDDDDEDEDNIDGGGGAHTVRKFGLITDTSKQMQVLSALDNADSGSDEERFNEEQIYKGVYSFPKAHVTNSEDAVTKKKVVQNQVFTPQVSVPTITFTPISVESLQSQLNSQLVQLREQQSDNNDALCRLAENIKTADEEIVSMDTHSHALSIRYQFFQEMRCYIRDLLSCLTEKVCCCCTYSYALIVSSWLRWPGHLVRYEVVLILWRIGFS